MADFNQTPADGRLALTIQDISPTLGSNADSAVWQVTIYTFTSEAGNIAVRIGSGAQVLNDLVDVIITPPVLDLQELRHDGTYWRNSA